MGKPNKKLGDDITVYEDGHILKQVCRKGSEYLDSVNCKALWEIKGLDVKARWICTSYNGSGKHNYWWATPGEVIEREMAGESGCPHCRALEQEDVVSKKELLAAIKLQNASMKKADDKARASANRRMGLPVSPESRYYMAK